MNFFLELTARASARILFASTGMPEVAGDVASDALIEMAKNVWRRWSTRSPQDKHEDIHQLLHTKPTDLENQASCLAQEERHLTIANQLHLAAYLEAVPKVTRQALEIHRPLSLPSRLHLLLPTRYPDILVAEEVEEMPEYPLPEILPKDRWNPYEDDYPSSPPPCEASLASSAGRKRSRRGVSLYYGPRLGNIHISPLCDLLGFWGLTLDETRTIVAHIWKGISVNDETVITAWRDGRSHGKRKDGGVYQVFRAPRFSTTLTREQIDYLRVLINQVRR